LGPWWLWTIAVILAAGGTYAGLWARSATQKLAQVESARAAIAANSQELQTDRMGLERQLDQARASETKLRADGDALATVVGKLQKHVTNLEAELKTAQTAAEEGKAAEAQLAKLQENLAALKSERDTAKTEAASATEEKAALAREIADLKEELEKVRAQLAPAMTGATAPPPSP